MKTSFAIVLLCATLAAVCYADSSESSESKKCHKQRDNCHELFEGGDGKKHKKMSSHEMSSQESTSSMEMSGSGHSGSGMIESSGSGDMEGSGSADYELDGTQCMLIEALKNMTSLCSGSDQEIWLEFVYSLEVDIVEDDTISEDMKMVLVAAKMKAFFALHASIQVVLQYQMIGDWGMIFDVQQTAILINQETSQSVITMTSNDNMGCELFQAMLNHTMGKSAAEYNATFDFITKMRTECLSNTSLTYVQKMAYLSVNFKAFFSQHMDWEADFMGMDIEGFGELSGLLDVCDVFEQATTISTVFPSSQGSSSCQLVDSLTAAMNNASYNFSRSEKASMQDFISLLSSYFVSFSGDFSTELQVTEHMIYEFLQANSWLKIRFQQIQIGSWGGMYNFQFCGDNTFTGFSYPSSTTMKPSTASMSTMMSSTMMSSTAKPSTASMSTMKSSTMMSSTAKASSTTAMPTTSASKCSGKTTPSQLITAWNSAGNNSFTDSINYAMTFWSSRQRTSFQPFVDKCFYEISSSDSMSVKLSQVFQIITGYCSGDATKTSLVFSISITVHETGASWGSVGDWCGCQNSTSSG